MAGRGGGGGAQAAAKAGAPPFAATLGRARPLVRGVDWRAWLQRCWALEVERRRLFPWIAVAFGIGILLFFAAEGRPSLWAPLAVATAAAVTACIVRARPVAFGVAVTSAALFSGFASAVIRTRSVETPILPR